MDFRRAANSLWRAVSVSGMLAAFLFAIALSDSPRLHEHLHKSLGDHICAVTVFLSGACDHLTGAGSAAAAPGALTRVPFFFPPLPLDRAAELAFSRLEHAPPALS
ncbi:hypothetical protein BH18VER2_BH18VER2_03400 [soil metagenome]